VSPSRRRRKSEEVGGEVGADRAWNVGGTAECAGNVPWHSRTFSNIRQYHWHVFSIRRYLLMLSSIMKFGEKLTKGAGVTYPFMMKTEREGKRKGGIFFFCQGTGTRKIKKKKRKRKKKKKEKKRKKKKEIKT
jgi:hypothetical protein